MPYTSIEKPEIDFATSTALSEVRIQNLILEQKGLPDLAHSEDSKTFSRLFAELCG